MNKFADGIDGEYGAGVIINPYIAMTFQGVGFRSFELTFNFTPHSRTESDSIHKIIKAFRAASLPDEALGGLGLTYPMEIDVEYIGAGADWLFKYKKCVLTNVDVDYTSVGFYASMDNGFPAQTRMVLRFSENNIITADDVLNKGY
jgi:hypothetical protein